VSERLAIARFWSRPDGTVCLLHKRDGGWWLAIERDGLTVKTVGVSSPTEAIKLADQWARESLIGAA